MSLPSGDVASLRLYLSFLSPCRLAGEVWAHHVSEPSVFLSYCVPPFAIYPWRVILVATSLDSWYKDLDSEKTYNSEFYRQFKTKLKQFNITVLKNTEDQTITDQKEIEEIILKFYKDLYKTKEVDESKWAEVTKFLTTISAETTSLAKLFEIIEITAVTKRFSKKKGPGPDGLPAEFYERFWGIIGKPFTNIINNSLKRSKLPPSLTEGIISLHLTLTTRVKLRIGFPKCVQPLVNIRQEIQRQLRKRIAAKQDTWKTATKMKTEELVLSDVHLYSDNQPQDKFESIVTCVTASDKVKSQLRVVMSHFVFKLPVMQQYNNNALEWKELLYDDDGDLLVKREESEEKEVILLNHFLYTPLNLVGLQVWSGALLLSDYLLCYGHKILSEHSVLELGAGSGLCSIIAGMFSSFVFCTDFVDNVLEFSQNNVEMNKHMLGSFRKSNSNCEKSCPVVVKRFDWTKHECEVNLEDPWGWTMQEKDNLKRVTVILAADVIYDDNLTDAFFETAIRLMLQPPSKVLYITLEKRINFSFDVLDVVCPAYTYFYQYLQNLSLHSGHKNWDVQHISTCFPQLFQYDRTPQLELWRVEALLSK
ncbi:uncharacterized protein LOC143234915 [Tachypleus tridentatus]|uniref:uncharacterized protein LOC143234915 n=1 Tax=Tachypleus tridentatus TaxID=6853 RepID=UPI003FD59197